MKTYNVEIPVSDELLARAEKLAAAKGTEVEVEIRWAVIIGLQQHMMSNLSLAEMLEERKK